MSDENRVCLERVYDDVIPLNKLRDGEVCEIVKWTLQTFQGMVCQRHSNMMFAINSTIFWSDVSIMPGYENNDTFLVRPLKPGEKIVIVRSIKRNISNIDSP